MAPDGGLRGALAGGWAEPATRSYSSLATSGGGCLATSCGDNLDTGGGGTLVTPTTLTTHPCPAFPFDACGGPLARLGHCCSLAACGCTSSCPMPYRIMPVGELAKKLEVPEPWWPRAGGEVVKVGWQVHHGDSTNRGLQ